MGQNFDSTIEYWPGQQVLYNGVVYQCILAAPPGETPPNGTYWEVVPVLGPGQYNDQTLSTVTAGATLTLTGSESYGGAQLQVVKLTVDCTITLPVLRPGEIVKAALEQTGSGSFTVTWVAGTGQVIMWSGGSAPTLSTAEYDVDYVTFECAGTINATPKTVVSGSFKKGS